MTDKQGQGQRLISLIEALNLTQTVFSSKINVSQSYVNQMIRGNKSLSHKVINNITSAFSSVNIKWLLSGVGEMFLKEDLDQVREEPPAYLKNGSGLLEQLIQKIDELEAWKQGMENWKAEIDERLNL